MINHTSDGAVHYFAYGSNMSSATLTDRRGIDGSSARAARAAGWRLVLDKPPLVDMGHSFANIVPDAAAEVWGVLYEITREDLEHIDLTEGVLIDNYQRIEIDVEVAAAPAAEPEPATLASAPAAASRVRAFTLTSDRRDQKLLPSTRYMGILIAGATEHRLPAAYVEWLRSLPACPESAAALAFQPMFDCALRRG